MAGRQETLDAITAMQAANTAALAAMATARAALRTVSTGGNDSVVNVIDAAVSCLTYLAGPEMTATVDQITRFAED